MLDCGCFWIGQEKDLVGNCPGVDLGQFYVAPKNVTTASNVTTSQLGG